MNAARLHLNSRNQRHDGAIVMQHLKHILLAIACSSLMACGTRTPEVFDVPSPIIQDTPAPTPPVEIPALTPEIEPIPEPKLDFSSSVITQTKPDSRIPGTWSAVGRLLNLENAQNIFALPDGRVLFMRYGYTELKWEGNNSTPLKRSFGSGEIFDPKTGATTSIQGFDYEFSFVLRDGRIVFFHPKRTSVFDPGTNTFSHLNAVLLYRYWQPNIVAELNNGLIYADTTTGKYQRFDLLTGNSSKSDYPQPTFLAWQIKTASDFMVSIRTVVFQDKQGNTWKIRPDFVPKTEYSQTEMFAEDWFVVQKLNSKLETIFEKRLKLPIATSSTKLLDESTLEISGYIENRFGQNSWCGSFFMDLVEIKLHKGTWQECGRYTHPGVAIAKVHSTEILFSSWSNSERKNQLSLLSLDGNTSLPNPILNKSRSIYKPFALKSGRFFFAGGAGCSIQPQPKCDLGIDDPRDWAEIYDPTSHSFQLAADPKQIRTGARTAQLSDGRILMTAGFKEISKPGTYDPRESTFEPLDSIEIYTPEN
jgi:hypothetical protein